MLRARLDKLVALVVRAYFTKTSLVVHVGVYAAFIAIEGGTLTYFLNSISVEAVFVGLLVGISTKQAIGAREGRESLLVELRDLVTVRDRRLDERLENSGDGVKDPQGG